MRIDCPRCGGALEWSANRLPEEGVGFPCAHCGAEVKLRPRPAWKTPGPAGAWGPTANMRDTPGPAAAWGPEPDGPAERREAAPPSSAAPTWREAPARGRVPLARIALGLGAAGILTGGILLLHDSGEPLPPHVAAWSLAYPALAGSAAEALAQGNELLASGAAAKAEQAFQRAAILAPDDLVPLARWAEALASEIEAVPADERSWAEALQPDPAIAHAKRFLGEALARHPGAPELHRALALLLASHGEDAEAKRHAEEALRLSPDAAESLAAAGRAWLASDPERALSLLDRAVAASPERTALLVHRAEARLALGDVAGALGDLEKRLGAAPADPLAFRFAVDAARSVGDDERARALLSHPPASDPLRTLATADLALESGDAARAESLLAQLAGVDLPDPLHGAIAARRAAIARSAGDLPKARSLLGEESAAEAWQRSLVALDAGDDANATAALASLPADTADARLLAARIALKAGRLPEAITALERARDLDPQRPEPLLFLAAALLRAGDPARAEAALRLLAEADLPPARDGILLESAATRLEAAAPLLASHELGLGWLRYHQGRSDEATALAGRALDAAPASAPALALACRLALDAGDAKRATALAQRLRAAAASSPLGPHLAARARLLRGDVEGAKDAAGVALSLRSDYPPALAIRASLDGGDGALRGLLAKNPDNPVARVALYRRAVPAVANME